ncbi:hypothetical protein ACQVP2_32565 [Methylobacterium aquaticum]|uniref:hypothetical protein n=1 Tax=Methylobacterium aquaticum TaxID=270351 RepID=UPI003D1872DD
MPTKTTERRPTAPARPVLEAERRAATAEKRANSQAEQIRASADRVREVEHKAAADLADMREDRDRWRKQAEKLAVALERLRAPVVTMPAPVAAPSPIRVAEPAAEATLTEGHDTTILFGIPSIAEHLGITERRARHLSDKGSLPTFKLPKSAIICARPETLKIWLAEQEAAAKGAH